MVARPHTVSIALSMEARRRDWLCGKQQVRCELMPVYEVIGAEPPFIYFQRAEGCGYDVICLSLKEAEQVGKALIKMVDDVKAYTNGGKK